MKRLGRFLSIILVFAMLFNLTVFSYADKIEIQEAKSAEANGQEEEDPGGQDEEEVDLKDNVEDGKEDPNKEDGEDSDPAVELDRKLEEILAKKDLSREVLLSHLLEARKELKDLGEIEEAQLEKIEEKIKELEAKLLELIEVRLDQLLEKPEEYSSQDLVDELGEIKNGLDFIEEIEKVQLEEIEEKLKEVEAKLLKLIEVRLDQLLKNLEEYSAQDLADELGEIKDGLDDIEEIEEADLEGIVSKLEVAEERLIELAEVEEQAGEDKEDIRKEILDLLETLAKNEEGQEAPDQIEAYRKKLDQDLGLEDLKSLRNQLLILLSISNKTIESDSLIKAKDQIVYIVTYQDERSTKEKYKEEFGEVIVTNHILKIFEEVRYDKTKYLTKEEAENKDLIVILEKDIDFKEEVANAGYQPDWIDYKTLEIHDNLNSFKLMGQEKQRKIHFNFLTQSVKTEIDNINIGTSIVSGGYGHDVDFTIKNSYINYIRGIDFSEKEHINKEKSKININININIENSTIDEMIGVHGVDNKVADYTYEFDFNIKNSKISKFLGCITLSPDGDYLDIAEKKVKIDHVNITSANTDFQHFNGVLNAQGPAGMGAEVGDVNINLDNINVEKIEGMKTSYPYNEGYMVAIMDSTGTMADYSFGNINFSMNSYSIEKDFFSFIFTSMNPKEANVKINKIDLKLTDGGDKNIGKSNHYLIGHLGTAGRSTTYPEYEDLIHPINFKVEEGINVDLEKVLASSVYLFNSYSEKNQTPKNMSINSDINIKVNDQVPDKGVYYIGLGANTGFNGNIVYNYGGIKYSNGNYFDMKSRKDPGKRFGECLEENQSGNRTLIYNPINIFKGINAFTGTQDYVGVLTGVKEIYLSTPLKIDGSDKLGHYAEAMKETKLFPLKPYTNFGEYIIEDEWKLGDLLVLINPSAGQVSKDTFIQGWTDNPPYNLDYFPTPRENIPTFWFLTVNITLYGNGGKFKNGEYDFYQIHVSEENQKLEDYFKISDTNNYFELDDNGEILLDNEGNPIDLRPVHPDGLEFLGWTISKDGSIEEDESNRIDFDTDTVFKKNLHIYAKWKDEKVKVEFNTNGGSEVEPQEIYINNLATKPEEPTRANHKFIGWYIDKDFSAEFDFKTEVTEDITLYAKWKENKKVTVKFNTDGGSEVEPQEIYINSLATKPGNPTKANHEFEGWYKNKELTEEFKFETPVTEDITLYAKWKEVEEPAEDKYKIIYNANGGKINGEDRLVKEYEKGDKVTKPIDKPSRYGYKFKGWFYEDGNTVNFGSGAYRDIELYAKWVRIDSEPEPKPEPEIKPDIDGWDQPSRPEEDKLNKEDHLAYIKGYPDINVRPEGNITREEVATVFYRLLTDRYRASVLSETNKFPDVDGKRWSNKEISTMANANIIKGYEDGSFRPREEITRAEVAAIAARFDKLESGQKSFSDIEGHWAEKYIRSAAEKDWVKGYEDNSFRPNKKMTRAEFVTLVNGVLERKVREENILKNITDFKDLKKSAWYYEDMVEATNSHSYDKERLEDGSEVWLELIEDR